MALGDGSQWNEALPDNDTVANQIDDYDRDLRIGVRSRMAVEHIWPASQTATGQSGMHSYISFQPQTGAPTLVAASSQVAALYVQTNSLFFENSGGTSVKVISATNKIETAGLITTGALPVGSIVQVVATQIGTVATGTSLIPADNTIPYKTEGTEFMTLAITPTSATNNLHVNVHLPVSYSIDSILCASLLQNTLSDAIACGFEYTGTSVNSPQNINFTHVMSAGTTGAVTFKVNAGGADAGTLTVNGRSGLQLYGGKLSSTITIFEVQA